MLDVVPNGGFIEIRNPALLTSPLQPSVSWTIMLDFILSYQMFLNVLDEHNMDLKLMYRIFK